MKLWGLAPVSQYKPAAKPKPQPTKEQQDLAKRIYKAQISVLADHMLGKSKYTLDGRYEVDNGNGVIVEKQFKMTKNSRVFLDEAEIARTLSDKFYEDFKKYTLPQWEAKQKEAQGVAASGGASERRESRENIVEPVFKRAKTIAVSVTGATRKATRMSASSTVGVRRPVKPQAKSARMSAPSSGGIKEGYHNHESESEYEPSDDESEKQVADKEANDGDVDCDCGYIPCRVECDHYMGA